MAIELWVQYFAIIFPILALVIRAKGMKRYIPVAMFASLYANIWCYLAKFFTWWEFPYRLYPSVEDISVAVNMVFVPVAAMFWVRYSPISRMKWALLWSVILGGAEFFVSRYTQLIRYGNGYEWYYSLLLWIPSWFIWLGFHKWFYKEGWDRE
jgi:hypothetical protein